VSYEGYSETDFAEEDRPQSFMIPKRYRRYNQTRRKARSERLQRYREHNEERRKALTARLQEYREHNEKRRREGGTRTQRTK
jgi:hypothetical protein